MYIDIIGSTTQLFASFTQENYYLKLPQGWKFEVWENNGNGSRGWCSFMKSSGDTEDEGSFHLT